MMNHTVNIRIDVPLPKDEAGDYRDKETVFDLEVVVSREIAMQIIAEATRILSTEAKEIKHEG